MSDHAEQARELAARGIERRKFLKGALGISALTLLQGNALARAVLRGSAAAALPSSQDNFTTIVVGMMENRSFDHYLGWLGPELGGTQTFSNPTSLAAGSSCSAAVLPVDDATPVDSFHLEDHCQMPDPDHGWNGGRVELNNGAMNGFVERSGPVAMGYFNPDDVPFLSWLVRDYTTFSAYHCSVLGPTYPNREYLHSAQAGGIKSNDIPIPTPSNPSIKGYTWPTIWDRLNDAGVDWAFYGTDVPTIALFFHEVYAPQNIGKVRHIVDFYIDAALGLLPRVAFIDPSFFTIGNDDHPAHDIKLGQRFISDAFLAVKQGPQWYDATSGKGAAFVLTYDEWGGFFDHVAPPRVPDNLASSDPCEDWGQLGFRVPTVLASPFARKGFVGTNLYDHTSILRMIEWNFNLPPLTLRDAAANNLAEALDLSQTPRIELDSEPPAIPVHLAGLACSNEPFDPLHAPMESTVPDVPLPPFARPSGLPASATVSPLARSADQFEEPHKELRELADSGYFGRLDFRERAKQGVFRD
jgi:phospholipase C